MTLPNALMRLAVILVSALLLGYCALAPWQGAIARYIKNNGERASVSLIPRYFAANQPRDEVITLLEGQGFRPGGLLLESDLEGVAAGEDALTTFRKSVGANGIMTLFCSVDVVVFLAFDEAGGLASAGGRARPVCL